MGRRVPILLAFLAGAVVASIAWRWHLLQCQVEVVTGAVAALHGQAGAGEQILSYLDEPQPEKVRRLGFMASNMVAAFSVGIKGMDQRYPYLHIQRRWSSESQGFEDFLRQRQARTLTNGTAGAKR